MRGKETLVDLPAIEQLETRRLMSAPYDVTNLSPMTYTLGSGLASDIVTGPSVNSLGEVVGTSSGEAVARFPEAKGAFALINLSPGTGTGTNNLGYFLVNDGASAKLAFVHRGHPYLTTLPPLADSGVSTAAYAINDSNIIVGASTGANTHAIVWVAAKGGGSFGATALPELSGWTNAVALGVSNSDVIVGAADVANGTRHAVAWVFGKHGVLTAIDLTGDPSSKADSAAHSVNLSGTAVGFTLSGSEDVPIETNVNTGKSTQLPILSGYGYARALDINTGGTAVGFAEKTSSSSSVHAATEWIDGKAINLNSLIAGDGWYLEAANSINAEGDIVGIATFDDVATTFLLTPHT